MHSEEQIRKKITYSNEKDASTQIDALAYTLTLVQIMQMTNREAIKLLH